VSRGLAMDSRTGARIQAGVGYGGSCFHRDLRALDHLGRADGLHLDLLRAVGEVNSRRRLLPLRRRPDLARWPQVDYNAERTGSVPCLLRIEAPFPDGVKAGTNGPGSRPNDPIPPPVDTA
jgi:hypothetical protein